MVTNGNAPTVVIVGAGARWDLYSVSDQQAVARAV